MTDFSRLSGHVEDSGGQEVSRVKNLTRPCYRVVSLLSARASCVNGSIRIRTERKDATSTERAARVVQGEVQTVLRFQRLAAMSLRVQDSSHWNGEDLARLQVKTLRSYLE